MRPLRILMIAPQPFLRPRGTPFSVLHRIRSLTGEGGHRVDLLTYPFGDEVELDGLRTVRSARPPGIGDVRIGPSPAKAALDLPLFRQGWKMAREGAYDLVHTHEEAGWLGARMRRRLGLPHLYDMHSSLPQQLRNFGRWDLAPVRTLFERLERGTLAASDGVIAICPALGERAREVGYEGPLEVIENTLELPRPPVQESTVRAFRARHGLEGGPLLAYTGTLERYQGLELLLEGAARARTLDPSLQLLVVGGSPAESADLVRRAPSLGLEEGFTALPAVPPEEVPVVQQAADLLASTRTHGTNTPLKIYQYLRAGRPIVATRIPSHTQVLDEGCARLVEPEAEAVAEGILALLRDPEEARRLSRGAAQVARERYSDERYHAKVEAIVRRVAGE